MPEALPTREVFRNFPFLMQVIFYLISFGAMGVFFYGFYRRFQKYRRGRPANRFNNLGARIIKATRIMAQNSTIWKRDAYAGFAHTLIFWGFVILFIGTVIVFIDHDILRFLGVHLLQGTFYLGFSVILDIFGVLFLIGLVMMMIRRGALHPPQLDYARVDLKDGQYDRSGYSLDDRIFLGLLFLIGFTGFLIEGFRISADRPPFEVWSPVGWALADITDALGLQASANTLHAYTWWTHAIIVLIFIAYIPYSKAMHMIIDYVNLIFKNEDAAQRLPRIPEEMMKQGMGYAHIEDFTWKELLDFDACTKCGRCHIACPARASGTPLSPRDLILDLRTYADSTIGIAEWLHQTFSGDSKWPGEKKDGVLVAGEVIKPATLWACTTCMACVEACPVGIEHLTSIVQMRRRLVDQGIMDDSLQEALMNIGDYGNSFGQPERMRGKWTQGLDFKVKDVRKEPADYLWFVGDYASFDPRLQELSRTVARVMNKLGVDFGILYDGEKNSGNDVRRVGEEGLYEMLVEDNLATMSKAKFKEIFTTDPHSFNTIKNEYPEFGGNYTIYHYTGLLAKLIDEGKLKFSKKLNYRVTYHDPCYLGRYNREVDAPRKILRALGVEFYEMPRCGTNTFCCGAGGGRIWMDDSNIQERPSEMRIKEALSLGELDYFVVACPKDYTMYSDAVKTSGNEGKIEVKDIIELVEEAL
ncbi:MAG: 4Fe-4S dicluster domain-containing protein [Calditrichaeota bacterium]|nr:MAG: 4Fe-4S dicluster domain-containing protein [Calditrichota bacterium]